MMTGPGCGRPEGSGGEGHRPEGAWWAGRCRGTAPPTGLLGSWTLPPPWGPVPAPCPPPLCLPAHPGPVNKISPPVKAEHFSNRTYFLYIKAFPFLPPYHCFPHPPIFLSLIPSPSLLLLLPWPSSLLQVIGHDFGHNRGFKLSPFFQFSELKPYP